MGNAVQIKNKWIISSTIQKKTKTVFRPCDYPECPECGEFRAPKDRSLREYYWFCLKHVTQYNKNWDFYLGLSADEIEESTISDHLYTGGYPDPDLLIRTSKEERISNFLLYQMAYTEFYFTDVLWPDFNEEELKKALLCYQNRQRRFGGA